jgi:hypothetical protein
MGTVAAPSRGSHQETAEDRFRRLLAESQELLPEAIGSPEEIKQDALATFNSWSKLRSRAKSA